MLAAGDYTRRASFSSYFSRFPVPPAPPASLHHPVLSLDGVVCGPLDSDVRDELKAYGEVRAVGVTFSVCC